MKTAIIVHSVCGNSYLLAKHFETCLKNQNKDVTLYRIQDADRSVWANIFPSAGEFANEIDALPTATADVLLQNDHIVLGCPTYFGNVSAEMKAFMDSASVFWVNAGLNGRTLTAFTSASNSEGGGGLCLQAINTFGQHVGMGSLPVPADLLPDISFPAYGFITYSGSKGDQRPAEAIYRGIAAYCERFIK